MTFIKTLLIIIVIYYVLKIAFKYFFNKFISKYTTQSQQPEYKTKKQKEGTVNVEFTNENKVHKEKDKGEYVDFEDIK